MYWLPAILILPYFFMLLKLNRSLYKIKPFKVPSDPGIFVSVIIACRNEEKYIPILLGDLAIQNYPGSLFEVIIVNDGSTDHTADIASAFSGITNMKILANTGSGKKQALRTGIVAARGNLIVTTDADCRMGLNWIRTIAVFYELTRPDMIISPVVLKSLPGFFSRIQELEFMSLQGITAGSALSGDPVMCNGANLAFNREQYLQHSHNLHDEINSGDDIFLLHSLKSERNSKVLWLESNDATITTESSLSLISFLNQRSRWISKAVAYHDKSTILLGILTFAAICLQISYIVAFLISPALLPVLSLVLILKSIPDFLILLNTTGRYGKRKLMWWFLPAQLFYPFYILSVVFYSLIFRGK
jgi:cellulose synthase/poly-beta-1,6-N-acetylglucosamine synthase-like glycosyltransferase